MLCCCCLVAKLCLTLCNPVYSQPDSSVHGILQPSTGMGCHFLLQAIFPTQGYSQRLPHWQADSLPLCHLRNIFKMLLQSIHQKNPVSIFMCFSGGSEWSVLAATNSQPNSNAKANTRRVRRPPLCQSEEEDISLSGPKALRVKTALGKASNYPVPIWLSGGK